MSFLKSVLLATLLTLGAIINPARAEILWGVNGHPLSAYPGVSVKRQIAYVKDLGMKSYRFNISRINELPALTEIVREAKAQGIDVLPVITPGNVDLDHDSAKEIYDKSYQLAVALISPLKNDVRVWELGNELENYAIIKACEIKDDGSQYNCAWGPAGGVSPLDYYGPRWAKVSAVLKGLSDGAIAVDPTIRKAIGTAGWGHTGAFARMQQDKIDWDISVWHLYGQDPEWAFRILAQFKHPIWVTEVNNPEGSRAGGEQQAIGLTQMANRLRQLQRVYRVEAAHIYELMDEPYWAPSFEAIMGLVELVKDGGGGWTPGDPKPAYQAIKQFIRGPDTVPPLQRGCGLNADSREGPVARAQVAYGYCLILGRAADGGGLESWTNALNGGTSVTDMLLGFIGSDEFIDKYTTFGLSHGDYVTLLHRLLINRDPDGQGRANYIRQLEAHSLGRRDVAKAIIGSDEFRTNHPILSAVMAEAKPAPAKGLQPITRDCNLEGLKSGSGPASQVTYAFCLVLGRKPDGQGLQDWMNFLEKGSTTRQLVAAMLGSEEFQSTNASASLDNKKYVALMYRLLLDRDPDGAGLASYAADLGNDRLTRADLRKALIDSGEFASRHPVLFTMGQPAAAANSPQANSSPPQAR
jgi:hypothetical protein